MNPIELNIDTLPGPTHSFSGLAQGNIASQSSRGGTSNPRLAALQCLEKMKIVSDLGIPQAILPPLPKPNYKILRSIVGKSSMITEGTNTSPLIESSFLSSVLSSATMWTANAATVTPSCDSKDGKVHITPANLASHLHRHLDVPGTNLLLKSLFPNRKLFTLHEPLVSSLELHDEGAANHIRFSKGYCNEGVHLFVYGRSGAMPTSKRFYPRHAELASTCVASRHGLQRVIMAQQSPHSIDMGVFHNDVIATGHQDLFLVHERAYVQQQDVLRGLQDSFNSISGNDLYIIEISEAQLPLSEAVSTYFFNCQILQCPYSGGRILLAPSECSRSKNTMTLLKQLEADPKTRLKEILFIELDESMKNGGGPACLRLRAELTGAEFDEIPQSMILNNHLYNELKSAISALYPEAFSPHNMSLEDIKDSISTTYAIWILLGLENQFKSYARTCSVPITKF